MSTTVRKSKIYLNSGIEWEKTISLGKVAWQGSRKINEVEIELRLKYDRTKDRYRFSVSADVFNSKKTDIVAGGQCLDGIWNHYRAEPFKKIYRWWKLYHLNDLHAGTPEQEQYLDEHKAEVKRYIDQRGLGFDIYSAQKHVLEQAGLLEVEYEGKPYKYGHDWIYFPIPEEDLRAIIEYLEEE